MKIATSACIHELVNRHNGIHELWVVQKDRLDGFLVACGIVFAVAEEPVTSK